MPEINTLLLTFKKISLSSLYRPLPNKSHYFLCSGSFAITILERKQMLTAMQLNNMLNGILRTV